MVGARKAVLAVALLVTIQAHAKKIEGYIIFKNKEKVNVTLSIPFKLLAQEPNFEAIQRKIKYLDENDKAVFLRPDDAEEVSFVVKGVQIRMISVFDNLGLGGGLFSSQINVFLKLEIDGKLRLFTHYFTNQSPGMYNSSTGTTTGYTYGAEKWVLQKGNTLFQPRSLSFKKDMSEFLSDCQAIGQKIKDREFKKGDMEQIVKEYNDQCSY